MSVVWYGFFIPRYGGIGMELIYHLGMGYPQGTLNQGIDVHNNLRVSVIAHVHVFEALIQSQTRHKL